MSVTWDQRAPHTAGRHARRDPRPPGPPGSQFLGAPVPDHRRDRLGPPGPGDGPTPWHVAEPELTLLRPPPENMPKRQKVPPRPREGPGVLAYTLTALLLAIACFGGSFAGTVEGAKHMAPAPATAAVLAARTSESIGNQMLDWAEAHETGHWYVYGGTGPYGYDCSGAVYAAALHVLAAHGIHVTWPRDTYDIRAAVYSGRYRLQVIPVSQARRGDLLIWPGWGHVEFKTIWHNGSFGALNRGTRVGWHAYNGYWWPILAIRILY